MAESNKRRLSPAEEQSNKRYISARAALREKILETPPTRTTSSGVAPPRAESTGLQYTQSSVRPAPTHPTHQGPLASGASKPRTTASTSRENSLNLQTSSSGVSKNAPLSNRQPIDLNDVPEVYVESTPKRVYVHYYKCDVNEDLIWVHPLHCKDPYTECLPAEVVGKEIKIIDDPQILRKLFLHTKKSGIPTRGLTKESNILSSPFRPIIPHKLLEDLLKMRRSAKEKKPAIFEVHIAGTLEAEMVQINEKMEEICDELSRTRKLLEAEQKEREYWESHYRRKDRECCELRGKVRVYEQILERTL
jgi:hypothetical protein